MFCEGPILDAVQRSHLFNDSKTFVDMPMNKDPEDVTEAFAMLEHPEDPEVLQAFLEEHFLEPGHELQQWTPTDFVEHPPRLMAIANETLRGWALDLNRLWATLGRIQTPDVQAAPQRHSALPRRYPAVVPGGRFRETYYWDTYWIVRGLLVSGMPGTARGVIENLLDDVRSFGFVPNGGRAYYLDRSQPPLLTEMVLALHAAEPNTTWLSSALPALEREYEFWMDPTRGHVINVTREPDDRLLHLNIYASSASTPRPESYAEDVATADEAAQRLGRPVEDVYRSLRSAAETGWDFSSRWFGTGSTSALMDLGSVNTSAVVPVDLNAIMYRVERGIADIHQTIGGGSVAPRRYRKKAADRLRAMNHLLWETGRGYRDFRLDTGKGSDVVSVSDFAAPLWAGITGPESEEVASTVARLQDSGVLQAGGAATTTTHSSQQWDFPNAWAPLQLMLIEGLEQLGPDSEALELARELASVWVDSCLAAWQAKGFMYEKYDATKPGVGGGGGEYTPQVGFGWSNGVALVLLERKAAASSSAFI